MQVYDIARSIVTDTMLAALLFTLARPKYHVRTLWAALAAIVAFGLGLSVFFYQRNDYTTLGKLSIPSFILISAALVIGATVRGGRIITKTQMTRRVVTAEQQRAAVNAQ